MSETEPDLVGETPLILDSGKYILRLNGIPTSRAEGTDGDGFIYDPQGHWRALRDDNMLAVQDQCVRIHDALAACIFGGSRKYYELLPIIPQFVSEAGLNSESTLTRDTFEKLLAKCANKIPELNRFLYLYDCRALVSAIQECSKEVSQLTGEFYRALNLDPFFVGMPMVDDATRWSTSPTTTYLTAMLGFIYIRMHSLLDYLAKLAREIDKLCTDFSQYPKLKSANFLFGSKDRLSINNHPGSVFEKSDLIEEIEVVRNRLIHDGLLDDMPKAYEVIKAGIVTERFILMPDRTGKCFDAYKGRRLFYGREDRINLRLAGFVRDFHGRQIATLEAIRGCLKVPES